MVYRTLADVNGLVPRGPTVFSAPCSCAVLRWSHDFDCESHSNPRACFFAVWFTVGVAFVSSGTFRDGGTLAAIFLRIFGYIFPVAILPSHAYGHRARPKFPCCGFDSAILNPGVATPQNLI